VREVWDSAHVLLDMRRMKTPTNFLFMLAAAARKRVRLRVSRWTCSATSSGSKNWSTINASLGIEWKESHLIAVWGNYQNDRPVARDVVCTARSDLPEEYVAYHRPKEQHAFVGELGHHRKRIRCVLSAGHSSGGQRQSQEQRGEEGQEQAPRATSLGSAVTNIRARSFHIPKFAQFGEDVQTRTTDST
jgi:hypothetical protein